MIKNILITGGAGYIGSHIAEILVKNKKKIYIIDNLSTGFRNLINKNAKFFNLDLKKTQKVKKIIIKNKIDSVIHLAASTSVTAEKKNYNLFYKNNVECTNNLIKACKGSFVKNFVFSSTAAVYKSSKNKVTEKSIIKPKSSYGKTKLKAEKIIIKNLKKLKINYAILRFFNVVGASPSKKIGPLKRNDTVQVNLDSKSKSSTASVSVIGAGNYSKRIIVPYLSKTNANLETIFSRNGFDSTFIAKKYKFKESSTNVNKIWEDPRTNTVFVLTRHNSHAEFIIKSLKCGKNVFVEKPLCTTQEQLELISEAYMKSRYPDGNGPILMAGFNRRFSKLTEILKKELSNIKSPKAFNYTCNAGYLDNNHWTNDDRIGGGRLIGEACHFLDLIMYLSESKIDDVNIVYAKDDKKCPDTFSLNVKFNNGSIGNINYFSNGNKRFAKERLEVFSSGSIFCLDNFISLKAWGVKGFKNKRYFKQNKGQQECIKAFVDSISLKKKSPIKADDLFEVQRWLLKASKNLT